MGNIEANDAGDVESGDQVLIEMSANMSIGRRLSSIRSSIEEKLPPAGDAIRTSVTKQFDTKSNMHENWDPVNDKRLAWYTPYGLSSFTYAILGVLQLTVFAGNFDIEPHVPVPLPLEAACLVLQSLATLLADVVFMGEDSCWHALDRVAATLNVLLVLCNMAWISWLERLLYLVVVLSGLSLLRCSRAARLAGDIPGVACWHGFWHLWFPCGLAMWLALRQWPAARGGLVAAAVLGSAALLAAAVRYLRASRALEGLAVLEEVSAEVGVEGGLAAEAGGAGEPLPAT